MDQVLKGEWVAALRSGEYRQGKHILHADGGFCCLGVLLDIMGAEWVRESHPDLGWVFRDQRTGGLMKLTDETRDAIGMDETDMYELIEANDAGSSFIEIADTIERMG